MKNNSVAFISVKLRKVFESLKQGKFEDKQLYDFIYRGMNDLEKNPIRGTKIKRKLWPKEYVNKYEITNLWKYDLPNAWRILYTIEKNDIKILSIILEWMTHKEYERRFKY